MSFEFFSHVWTKVPQAFDPVQFFFNGNFWEVFQKRFRGYTKGNILDLACGTGELRKHITPQKYTGVDLNPNYISYAKDRFKNTDTKFYCADITKLKRLSNINTAFFISAAHHLSDKQMVYLAKNIKRMNVSNFILVDGYPLGPLAPLLSWLDAVLAGGKYFRNEEEIGTLVAPYLKVIAKGQFFAKHSFYCYPFLVCKRQRLTPSLTARRSF